MKVSYTWLQTYFDKPLPKPEKVKDLLTMHSFEVESIEDVDKDFILDVKVMPDRAHDCLSHLGIAREVSVIAGIPLKKEFLTQKELNAPESNIFRADIEDPKLCKRFSVLIIENVEVKESPLWLKRFLESIGERSVNNIVDATNFVMFSLGQPLHAYDMALLKDQNGAYRILVRNAKAMEKASTLDGKEYVLSEEDLVITDGNSNVVLGIAGIKGGKATEITTHTKSIVLESANFNPIKIRATAKRLGLRTGASIRFENDITPELTTEALAFASELIFNIAKTDDTRVEGVVDLHPGKTNLYKIGVTLSEIKNHLGVDISHSDVVAIFRKLSLSLELVKNLREKFLQTALSLNGSRYKFGASVLRDSPSEFDCSGLVAYSAMQAGIVLPRMSVDQYVFCTNQSENDITPGDLIFALTEGGTAHTESKEWMKGTLVPEGIDHVGIMISKEEVFHTSIHNPNGARTESLKDFLKIRDLRAFRKIPEIDGEERLVLTIPALRLDLRTKEDLIEEIGRIYGYENIKSKPIKPTLLTPEINQIAHYSNLIRNVLLEKGFSEVYTSVFTNDGQVELLNPLARDKSFLRKSLVSGLQTSLELNSLNADLLGLSQIKIFEIGNVFEKNEEYLSLGLGIFNTKTHKGKKNDEEIAGIFQTLGKLIGAMLEPKRDHDIYHLDIGNVIATLPAPTVPLEFKYDDSQLKYKKISSYPFVLRDIAVFVPKDVSADELLGVIEGEAGNLLVNSMKFDEFKKDDLISYAHRLVFQSLEKTLTDDGVNVIMKKINESIASKGWQVR